MDCQSQYNDPLLPPPGRGVSYGCVLVDVGRTQVLLRKPHGGYLGYAWTFAKGIPEPGESPWRRQTESVPVGTLKVYHPEA